MIRFVMLTHRSGEPIYVNPAQVMSVSPVFDQRGGYAANPIKSGAPSPRTAVRSSRRSFAATSWQSWRV